MRRRLWILIFSLGGVVLLLVICWPRSEPKYQGKRLSVWLKGFESDNEDARWQSAEAVRHIGTNALPLLIGNLQHRRPLREPSWKQKLRDLFSKQSLIKIDMPYSARERLQTLAALDALGPAAKDAVPVVEAVLHEQPPDPDMLFALARFGSDGVPALNRALTNDQKMIRMGARVCLDMQGSHSELLFPKTQLDAEFTRRICEYHTLIMRAALEDYKKHRPEQFSADGLPLQSLPTNFIPPNVHGTNEPAITPQRESKTTQ